jgi:prepilin-type processing-associated H-X9-DG protein/prepilin-type N-terminal cleavage/methylation domain-containing protein
MSLAKPAPSIHQRGFTLLELLTAMGIISVLTLLGFSSWKGVMGQATKAHCSSNLRQLSAAVLLYTSDHSGCFPPYVENGKDGSKNWYFGHESGGGGEGERDLDREAGPLYPYIQTVGQIEVCKGFNYGSALWKPKFKGASYGYGYNWILGGRFGGLPMNIAQLKSGSRVLLFGDCAQANTFQPPATPSKPLLEEFYIINERERTVHFRHSGRANMVFVDGHVESFKPYKGTEDKRIKGEVIGRITKKGSLEYLQ